MRDVALLLDQVWPGRERKLELVRGEQGDLAGSFSWLAQVVGWLVMLGVGRGGLGWEERGSVGRTGSLGGNFVLEETPCYC